MLSGKQSYQGQRNWSVDRRERGREAGAGAGLDMCECGVGRSHQSFHYTSQLPTGTAVLDRKTDQALTPWPSEFPSYISSQLGSHTLAPQSSLHKSSRPASGSLTQFRKYLNL